MDLTVTATPFYFGSMAAERWMLRRRAEVDGPNPADYTRQDTIASLSMGVGSLVMPFVAKAIDDALTPGTGRHPKIVVRIALGAAALTTIADQVERRAAARVGDESTDVPRVRDGRRRLRKAARRVAIIGGPVAIGAGLFAAASTINNRMAPRRQWSRNGGRDLGGGVAGWVAAVVGWDFIYYWNHRFMHEMRGLWALHVVHHSSEHYNLSTALRQPVADVVGVFIPNGILSRLGVRPRLVDKAREVNLLYQYWIHTDTIRQLGKAEEVFNTPSHHRVHHGSNSKYIDRNHGSFLILWDRLFGTFQREEEPVVYGLTKNLNSYNVARIAGHEYADIVRDVAGSHTWRDRLSFVLRGPGWAYERHAEAAAAADPGPLPGAEPKELTAAGVA